MMAFWQVVWFSLQGLHFFHKGLLFSFTCLYRQRVHCLRGQGVRHLLGVSRCKALC